MSSNVLQLSQRPAQAESQILNHADTDDHIGLFRPVSVLCDRREGDADDALLVEKLGEEIDMERLYPVVEDNDPIAVMADFSDCARHVISLRETWFDRNWSERAA